MNKNYSSQDTALATAFGGLNYQKAKYVGPIFTYTDSPTKSLRFTSFFHPFAGDFITKLNGLEGIKKLMNADNDGSFPESADSVFESYGPDPENQGLVEISGHPKLHIDFGGFGSQSDNDISQGPYAIYNQEVFFHIPLYIATRLSRNGKYAEAMKWFHYIFDPITNGAPDADYGEGRYWNVQPFKTSPGKGVKEFLKGLSPNNDPTKINTKIKEWLANPFKPHVVARTRPIAYQKNVIFKYIENILNWGDDLYRRDTRESINEATLLYVVASHILGDKPQQVPERGKIKAETFNSLKGKLDDFSNAVVAMENYFPCSSDIHVTETEYAGNILAAGPASYFCLPDNSQMLKSWEKVESRLYNIRHCMNIEGVERSLDLFEPAIDPALLVAATAKGLSISSILNDLNSPSPFYRFNILLQKASEFCGEVKSLGNSLLGVLEKKDGEELSRKRAQHESRLLDMVTAVRERQVLETKANKQGLEKNRETAIKRLNHYAGLLGLEEKKIENLVELSASLKATSFLPDTTITEIPVEVDVSLVEGGEKGVKLIPKEKEDFDKAEDAIISQGVSSGMEGLAGALHLIPAFRAHADPFSVGASIEYGGSQIGSAVSALAKIPQILGSVYSHQAGKASKMGSYIRREQEWVMQANMAAREIIQIDKQTIAAAIRIQIAEKELENHLQQISNAREVEEFLKGKFTNQELYQWMKEQLYVVYKQCYKLACDLGKKAEKAYRFELGVSDSNFIQYGYWDNMYQGLTSGEKLHLALKEMEKSFLEENRREFELTKHISIANLNPYKLLQLKQTGTCEIDLPEELFDMDYPGHYFRRIKSVSISIPCVTGPYTTVNCTLRLLKSSTRINTQKGTSDNYEHNNDDGIPVDDDRFVENNIPFKAIATSSAQNDSGVFELNFRDERYLPFEGAGIISSWKLELSGKQKLKDKIIDLSQFDFNSIADIILHVRYTAREDAGLFRERAVEHLEKYIQASVENDSQPLLRLYSLKHDFPVAFYQLLNSTDKIQKTEIEITNNHFLRFLANRTITVEKTEVLLQPKEAKKITTRPGSFDVDTFKATEWVNIFNSELLKATIPIPEYNPLKKIKIEVGTGAGNDRLKKEELEDILLLLTYRTEA